jgi:hypothetical protein
MRRGVRESVVCSAELHLGQYKVLLSVDALLQFVQFTVYISVDSGFMSMAL